MSSPKTLLGISTVFLIFAAVLGLLNVARVKGLETNLTSTAAARDAAEQRRASQEERLLSRRGESSSGATTPSPEAESKAAKAEADLAQVLKEKALRAGGPTFSTIVADKSTKSIATQASQDSQLCRATIP